jgi:hypothetical protein
MSDAREPADHFCPGCGVRQRPFLRYPWYFCPTCTESATDGAGRRLEFANAGLSGGFQWRHAGADDWAGCGHVIALIAGRPALIGEARFGGIVAEPIPDLPPGVMPCLTVDLRAGKDDAGTA